MLRYAIDLKCSLSLVACYWKRLTMTDTVWSEYIFLSAAVKMRSIYIVESIICCSANTKLSLSATEFAVVRRGIISLTGQLIESIYYMNILFEIETLSWLRLVANAKSMDWITILCDFLVNITYCNVWSSEYIISNVLLKVIVLLHFCSSLYTCVM